MVPETITSRKVFKVSNKFIPVGNRIRKKGTRVPVCSAFYFPKNIRQKKTVVGWVAIYL